jgi:cyanophycin synthetase
LTNTTGVYVNDERVLQADASGPKSARMILADPTVEVAVLETARGGMLREGLAFDRCDVGVVLNVSADHLGLRGIDTVEDLASVKAIVARAVSRRGISVLNADDPLTLRMARRAGGRIGYFSLRGGVDLSSFLQKHVAEGGLLATLDPSARGGELVLYEKGRRCSIMHADELPSTLNGMARFNVANALAAILAGHGLGASPEVSARALRAFTSSHAENPGRFNVHDANGFRVIVDYAHNPGAMRAMGDLVAQLRPTVGRVIGVVSIPGDRRDEDILEMGAIAAGMFDELIFRERPDGRGRPAGSVLSLLTDGALGAGFPAEHLHRISREDRSVDEALQMARPGDLVLIFPTAVDAVWEQVTRFQPAASALPKPAFQGDDTYA